VMELEGKEDVEFEAAADFLVDYLICCMEHKMVISVLPGGEGLSVAEYDTDRFGDWALYIEKILRVMLVDRNGDEDEDRLMLAASRKIVGEALDGMMVDSEEEE